MYTDRFYRTWQGPFPFTIETIRLVTPRKPGLYMILYNNAVAYIGRAGGSVYSRLSKHVTGHGNWAAARRQDAGGYEFVYYLCDDMTARQIESHVITLDKPPFNVKPEYEHFIENITVH